MSNGKVRKLKEHMMKKKELSSAQKAELGKLTTMDMGGTIFVNDPKHGMMPKTEWIKKKIKGLI